MQVQANRRKNLVTILGQMEKDGLSTREAQAAFLGGAVSAFRLQSMLDGTHIGVFFAESVEHALHKPRGWLSRSHSVDAPG